MLKHNTPSLARRRAKPGEQSHRNSVTTLSLLATLLATGLAHGQTTITSPVTWGPTTHDGDIIIASGGDLTLNGLTTVTGNVSVKNGGFLRIHGSGHLVLNCATDRQFVLNINSGGTVNCYGASGGPTAPRAAISGSSTNQAATVINLDGTLDMWHATMNYHYGVKLAPTGIFQGVDLVRGTWCGELIHGGGWARFDQSNFPVVMTIDSRAGALASDWQLNLPTNQKTTMTFGSSNFPPLRIAEGGQAALYNTLILQNTIVPWWSLFITSMAPSNALMNLTFNGDAMVSVAFLGEIGSQTQPHYVLDLPCTTKGTDWTNQAWDPIPGSNIPQWSVGNVSATSTTTQIPWTGYGFYLSPGSDVRVYTPYDPANPAATRGTTIFEAMLNYNGPTNAAPCRLEVHGMVSYSMNMTATTFEVGPNATLKLVNCRVGAPTASGGSVTPNVIGRITRQASTAMVDMQWCTFYDVQLHNWATYGSTYSLPSTCSHFHPAHGYTFVN